MDKRSKIILGLFGVVLLAIIVSEIVRPRPIDWRPSYTATDKIPFGCFVLFQEIKNLIPNTEIKTVEESVYDMMVQRDSTQQSNYLIINSHLSLDKQECHQLLRYVDQGNKVFIAATSISYLLSDTLNLDIQTDYTIAEDTLKMGLTHQKFTNKQYHYVRGLNSTYITQVDTANTTILGHIKFNTTVGLAQSVEKTWVRPNFVKTTFGKGAFYINTVPQAFSNYYMLGGNKDYVSDVFHYLDNNTLYWDNYKKAGRVVINSPMRFVLNQTALKWTYYLTMVGLLVFVIFRAKREQRIIPVIAPNENSSVEFARTVGSLYYQTKDYTDLVQKKMKYFMAYLRNQYYLDTSTISEKTARQLASKSGKTLEEAKSLLDYLGHLKGKTFHTEEDIINLNKTITAFKK